ncbi:MAG: mevalonate pyrophosphate decarboxylase [Thermoplasmatales archaeon]|nr:mevalonate pyrophosphate decarboxylase [Thermoplasmatales archaeon]MCW6169826.1 mevalonate pyrophosphate decarboxylase [Thermoplasmatales archaeon]
MSDESSFKRIESELVENGIIKGFHSHEPFIEDRQKSYGIGYPITGIEKFLGYFDKSINIANFPSISLLTDFSVALSECVFFKETGKDRVILDGEEKPVYTERARRALEFFKNVYDIKGSFQFRIDRKRKYRSAKGLGESAAIAAATARSLVSNVFGDDALKETSMISRLARLVSGSGTRSVSGGISIWMSYPYIREETSYGSRLPIDVGKIHFGCYPFPSVIQTANAHETAILSSFYSGWMAMKAGEIEDIIRSGYAIDNLLHIAQQEMYRMHSVLLSQGVFIHSPQSLKILLSFMEFQKKNEGIYITADTGPSLVLMSLDKGLIQEFIEKQKAEFIWGESPGDPGSSSEQLRAFDKFNTHA